MYKSAMDTYFFTLLKSHQPIIKIECKAKFGVLFQLYNDAKLNGDGTPVTPPVNWTQECNIDLGSLTSKSFNSVFLRNGCEYIFKIELQPATFFFGIAWQLANQCRLLLVAAISHCICTVTAVQFINVETSGTIIKDLWIFTSKYLSCIQDSKTSLRDWKFGGILKCQPCVFINKYTFSCSFHCYKNLHSIQCKYIKLQEYKYLVRHSKWS